MKVSNFPNSGHNFYPDHKISVFPGFSGSFVNEITITSKAPLVLGHKNYFATYLKFSIKLLLRTWEIGKSQFYGLSVPISVLFFTLYMTG